MMAVIRSAGSAEALATPARNVVHEMEPDVPITAIRPMEDVVDESEAGTRFNAVALGFLGVVAFVLAAVGIYGVVSCDVAARTNEIGIRIALGAERSQVLALVLGQGAKLAAIGVALGLAGAFGLTQFLQSMLFGVDRHDFYTFAAIALALAAIAIFAAYLPSRRAMALDPVSALRHE
jgi:putative ABC transport system permease protein